MFISAEEPALNHISPNVWYIGSGQGMWVEQGSSWEGSASSHGGGDLATYVVVAVPQSISLIYGWLTAIAQQVYCQEMGDRKPFSTYFQPKTIDFPGRSVHCIPSKDEGDWETRRSEKMRFKLSTVLMAQLSFTFPHGEWPGSVSPLLNMKYLASQVSSFFFGPR